MKRQRAIEDRALDWLIRKEEPDWSDIDQAELDAWLAEAMAHKAAFWRAQYGWREADRIASLGTRIHDDARTGRSAGRWWPVLVAASLIAAVGFGSFELSPIKVREARYHTQIGGHRIIPLADGSKVELNTATVVRTVVTEQAREVWLDSGEAFFEVAHRDGLPFVVHAGKQTVTVLGTKFSVRRDRDRVTVNVLEGRVRIDNGKESVGRAAIITAGDFAVTRGPSSLIGSKSEEHVESALAWRNGMLNFDQTSLYDVATEFNRYNRKPIVIGDAEAGRIPIGGSFRASNADTFVRLLRDAYGLKVEENAEHIKISR